MDTSALIALKNESETKHSVAMGGFENLLSKNIGIMTTNFVFAETYTLLRYRVGHKVAVEFGDFVRQSRVIQYVRASEEIENIAWKIAVKYQGKDFSFADCVSFALMEKFGINEAFAFDQHFEQFGFELYPKRLGRVRT